MTWISSSRRATLLPAVALTALLALTGCSGGQDGVPSPSTAPSESSASVRQVTDAELGTAMTRVVFSGSKTAPSTGGQCFVQAVRDTQLTRAATSWIVDSGVDDWGAAITGLKDHVSEADSAIFGSQELRTKLDLCADEALGKSAPTSIAPTPPASSSASTETKPASPSATASASTKPVPSNTAVAPPTAAPNLKPKYPQAPGEQIRSASQLEPGLVSTFSSFTQDEQQRAMYERAGSCLAKTVFDAGFSEKTLLFLAGGVELGGGAVADYLATEEDKALWASRDFKSKLISCTQIAATKTASPSGSK